MKPFFFALALLGTVAHADDNGISEAESVCSGMFSSQTKLQCMELVGQAKFFDPAVVATCKGFFSTDDTMKCLRTVKDRTYSESSLKACKSFFGTADTISCLESSGRKPKKNEAIQFVQIEVPTTAAAVHRPHAITATAQGAAPLPRQKVVAALEQIEAGNLASAKRILRELLEDAE